MSKIIRVKKNKDYSVMSNAAVNDSSLSWGAAGLLAYFLTKPDNWRVKQGKFTQMGNALNEGQ